MDIWQLKVWDRNAVAYQVCGSEKALRATYEEIQAALEIGELVDRAKTVELHGHSDTSDRAEILITIAVDAIAAVSLARWWSMP